MITQSFDSRTLTKMDLALEQACKMLRTGAEQHAYRRLIANRILACAEAGDTTLDGLNEAGRCAATELIASHDRDAIQVTPEAKRPRSRRSA